MKNKILAICYIIASLLCIWVSGHKFFIDGGSYLHLFFFCLGFGGLFCSVGSLPNFKFSDMIFYYKTDGLFWVRFFSRTWGGFLIKDIRKHNLWFSERNGYDLSFRVGNYYFATLKVSGLKNISSSSLENRYGVDVYLGKDEVSIGVTTIIEGESAGEFIKKAEESVKSG